MPVERFRSIEEANAAFAARGVDRSPRGVTERFRAVCALATALSPNRFPRGLRRFRGIEDAARDREAAERSCG